MSSDHLPRVVVAGGRDFRDYHFLADKLDKILWNFGDQLEIVTGGQVSEDRDTGEKYGADYLAEYYGRCERHCAVKTFPPDWDNLGKKAGPIRNRQMAEYGEYLVAFWDGKSKGTGGMIELAKEYGLKIRIVKYENI